MLQQRLSSQLLKILPKFLKFGGTLNFWVIHFNLLVFVLLLLNVWSYSFLWVRFRFCIYIVQWSGYCRTCIWCGIHIRGNGSQKFGLSLRGNQTLKQFFILFLDWRFVNLKRNCFYYFHCGLFRIYLSGINFGLLCGFTSVVRNFICIIPWESFFSGKIVVNRCSDVYVFIFFPSKECTSSTLKF